MTNAQWIRTILLIAGIVLAQIPIEANNTGHIIPYPSHIQYTGQEFKFSAEQIWSIESTEQQDVAEEFLKKFKVPHKEIIICTSTIKPVKGVVLSVNKQLDAEAYKLVVASDGINIQASDNIGFFYALQTIRQLLPAQLENENASEQQDWTIPTIIIEDNPRFEYRGLMLDASRFFIPKENVLKIIDVMALLKLNKMHFHLVDDNGWRIEIKKHPKLTEIGAWRVDRKEYFPGRKNPTEGEPTPIGGFYTQDDIREIVKYASDRMIDVIPEIEMPAHSLSALAAYPHLACQVVDQFIGVIPGIGGPQARVIFVCRA